MSEIPLTSLASTEAVYHHVTYSSTKNDSCLNEMKKLPTSCWHERDRYRTCYQKLSANNNKHWTGREVIIILKSKLVVAASGLISMNHLVGLW